MTGDPTTNTLLPLHIADSATTTATTRSSTTLTGANTATTTTTTATTFSSTTAAAAVTTTRPSSPLRQRKLFPGGVIATANDDGTAISAVPLQLPRLQQQQQQQQQRRRRVGPRLLQNATANVRCMKMAIGLYFILCVTMSGLVFTWTMASTLDNNNNNQNNNNNNLAANTNKGDGQVFLRNPFSRLRKGWAMRSQNAGAGGAVAAAASRSMLVREDPKQESPQTLQQRQQALQDNSKRSLAHPPPLLSAVTEPQVHKANTPKKDYSPMDDDLPEYLRIPKEEPVVQIINTRFMQHQPDLIELGLARLELLKTICLPTLQQQTSKNFLWIIRADPNLAEPLRMQLLEMIDHATTVVSKHHHHHSLRVVVLGSNDNPNGFRRDLPDETADQVWTPNGWALLRHFQQEAQTRIVLETRLDADDGLHIAFVERMQQEAMESLVDTTAAKSPKKSNDDNSNSHHRSHNWLIWCAGTHVEWQYGAPWEFLSAQHRNGNHNSSTESNNSDSSAGSLMPGLTKGCITPGLTKGYGIHVDYDDLPDAQHHMLHKKVRACKDHSKDHSTKKHHPSSNFHHCLVIWKEVIPAAIRGRTPTSAGMQYVVGKHMSSLSPVAQKTLGVDHPEDLRDKQDMMWDSVETRFEITRESVREMRTILTDHMHGIIKDNYDGQCTPGHSCKNSSRIVLKQLMEE